MLCILVQFFPPFLYRGHLLTEINSLKIAMPIQPFRIYNIFYTANPWFFISLRNKFSLINHAKKKSTSKFFSPVEIACKHFFHCHCKFWFNISQNAAKHKLNFCELLPDTMFTIRYGMPRSLLNSSALLIISSNISHDLFSKGEVRTNCSIWETQFMTKIK